MNILPFLYQGYEDWWIQQQFSKRQYPPANPTIFMKSAGGFPTLLSDAKKITEKMASSKEFSQHLMEAAQKNEKQKVISAIHAIGLVSVVDIAYNPDNLTIHLFEKSGCCHLNLVLRWR